jgi:hypothetical protein
MTAKTRMMEKIALIGFSPPVEKSKIRRPFQNGEIQGSKKTGRAVMRIQSGLVFFADAADRCF